MGLVLIAGTTLDCPLATGDQPGRCSWCAAPLVSRRKRWCSDECARAWGDQHVWARARQAALERDGWLCTQCGLASLDLAVHHLEAVGPGGYGTSCAHHLDGLATLCGPCHRAEHRFARDVARLLEWADGVVAEQMVLPGLRG